tara:strand:- start:4760 stop:6160 length:1401 start_codon:yes stop_codon:yes gene_type:complete
MRKIERTTLCLVDCYNYGSAVASLQKSMAQCEFERVIFLTNIEIEVEGAEVIQIPSISSTQQYSNFILRELYKYVTTDFVLITQHDGWILDGEQFDDRLYDYDYAGSVWPERDGLTVGNGGFSFRSKKLLETVANDPMIMDNKGIVQEDVTICRVYRGYLEQKYELKWATEELCFRFAFELIPPQQPTFGFHNFFHESYKPTVIIKRSAALGDCVQLEPIMKYFYRTNHNIVLDIPEKYFGLYDQHYFPVKHISKFDRNLAAREINLDMSYESRPGQPYQQSYFEFCGIKDYKLERPRLSPLVDNRTKLFRKYAIIHIDVRETPHRNIFGVDWKKVRKFLEKKGYTVIQIGIYKSEIVATEMNVSSISYMKFIIAGCDLFIGIDSAPAHIAVAYEKPCVLFFGSVNPKFIHPDLTGVEVVQNPCDKSGCWHLLGGTEGQDCFYNKQLPPCSVHTAETVIEKIKKLI